MSGFKWTKTREQQLRKEVSAFNRNVTRLAKIYGEDAVPEKWTLEDARQRVEMADNPLAEFRRFIGYKSQQKNRPSELQRLKKSVRKAAQEFNPETGHINYLDTLEKTARTYINKQRAKERKARGLEWDKMSKQQRARAAAQGNVAPVRGTYRTPKEIRRLTLMPSRGGTKAYLQNYLAAFDNTEEFKQIKAAVEQLMEAMLAKDKLSVYRLLGGLDDEATIEYVYGDDKSAYRAIPIGVRADNVLRFWTDEADKVLFSDVDEDES